MINGSVELTQLCAPTGFKNSYRLKDASIVVVESETLLKYHPCKTGKGLYNTKSPYLRHIAGYTVASFYLNDILNGNEYLLLLKDIGVMEIWNTSFTKIDSLSLGEIDQIHDLYLVVDTKFKRCFINFTTTQIFTMEVNFTKDSMNFVQKNDNFKIFYESSHKIVQFNGTLNVDHTREREFFALTMLIHDDRPLVNMYTLKVLKLSSKSKSYLYTSLLELKNLKLGCSRPIMKTIPTMGIFIFANNKVTMFEYLFDLEHHINGSLVETSCELNCSEDQSLQIITDIITMQNSKNITFKFATRTHSIVQLTLNLVFEDPGRYIFHWDGFGVETENLDFQPTILIPIESSMLSLCFLMDDKHQLQLFDLLSLQFLESLRSYLDSQYTIFNSDIEGYDVKKLVKCAGTPDNTGYIEVTYNGYSDFFTNKELIVTNANVKRFWNTKKGVYWVDLDNQLHFGNEIIPVKNKLVHVLQDGTLVENESTSRILKVCDLFNGDKYVYIDAEGYLKINDSVELLKIKAFKNNNFTKYSLFATLLNSDIYTIIAHENIVTVTKNFKYTEEDIILPTVVNDILLTDSMHILVSDINGSVYIIKLESQSRETIKLSNQKIKFHGISQLPYVLLECKDSWLLLSYLDGLNILKIDFPDNILTSVINKDNSIVMQTIENVLYKYTLDIKPSKFINHRIFSDKYFITNMINLPCSLKYSVVCATNSKFNQQLNKLEYFYELQVFDLDAEKVVSEFNISKYYPKSKISDMIAVPFKKNGDSITNKLAYAKQLMLNKCFIVSLDLEAVDDETMSNILLFSLDDTIGTLDFQIGASTFRQITSLTNYKLNFFLAAGEVLQAHEIDYSLKENTFKINQVSNMITTDGFFNNLIILPNQKVPINSKKKIKLDVLTNDGLFTLNILKGLQEFDLLLTDKQHIHIKPVPFSLQHQIIAEQASDEIITAAAAIQRGTLTIFAICYSSKLVKISFLFSEHEINSITFKLPFTLTSVTAINYDTRKDGGKTNAMFLICTANGGCYLISSITNKEKLAEDIHPDNLIAQQLIGVDNDETDIIFSDARGYEARQVACNFL